MPLNLTLFNSTDTLSASNLNDRFAAIENFINDGIEQSDLKSDQWVDPAIIVSPEFYGSPAPRTELISGEVHHRRVQAGATNAAVYTYEIILNDEYIPIHGMSATVHATGNADLIVNACWSCEELNSSSTLVNNIANIETKLVAQFALFIDGVYVNNTVRKLYAKGGEEKSYFDRKNFSICGFKRVARGIHNVSIRVHCYEDGSPTQWERVWVSGRSLTVEVNYF